MITYLWKIELYLAEGARKRYGVNASSLDEAVRKAKAHCAQFDGRSQFYGSSGQRAEDCEDLSGWVEV